MISAARPACGRAWTRSRMGYRLTRKAADDILHIYVEGDARFGAAQAETYHAALERVFGIIASNPEMAREREELNPPLRVHRFQAHAIIYKIEGDDVLIVRVRHGREDWINAPE